MTTSTKARTTIKFTALSPLTTRLLRARTELQQREGKIKVGRTVFTWLGAPTELDGLLDFLIMDEIPLAGASSKDVRRLRELRRFLRAALSSPLSDQQVADAAHVTITSGDDNRERILDLIEVLWEQGCDTPAGRELTDLAHADTRSDYRAWLADQLS